MDPLRVRTPFLPFPVTALERVKASRSSVFPWLWRILQRDCVEDDSRVDLGLALQPASMISTVELIRGQSGGTTPCYGTLLSCPKLGLSDGELLPRLMLPETPFDFWISGLGSGLDFPTKKPLFFPSFQHRTFF